MRRPQVAQRVSARRSAFRRPGTASATAKAAARSTEARSGSSTVRWRLGAAETPSTAPGLDPVWVVLLAERRETRLGWLDFGSEIEEDARDDPLAVQTSAPRTRGLQRERPRRAALVAGPRPQ